ncbi:ABC transporter substrate-binding protein [Halosimplex carlsbadense 2-9-1]|uniref:ABC transporter substrate-binding protein n=1 Tax=Halosimplex carlsbadense 2-9-1 TaxID=797114 RepID=M0D2R5_9EURY|nr:ABC transporter substrate-binding protein [Halosimplex carlsbadense]ELZ29745.1 ABC transporter substrate-binding protein [Halosimplex carlsbadense 2-9-1]
MRVASLLPSATEICYALGVEPVGVSHECDWPPEAADRPTLDRSRVDPDQDSAAINEQVAQAEREHGGVYEIDLDALAGADPDVVVTQGVCDVCAVDTLLVEEAIAEAGVDAEVLTTDVHGLDDLYRDIERFGDVFDREERAAELVADLRERVAAVRERTDGIPAAERPSVAVFDWLDPVMVAGHWMPELVEAAGGTYPMADAGDRSTPREWASVREADPDALVAAPCGFGLDQTLDTADELTGRPGFDDLTAVESGRVFAMDGHYFVNRPGPRLVDTLEHLAGLLHPDLFDSPPESVARDLLVGESARAGPKP